MTASTGSCLLFSYDLGTRVLLDMSDEQAATRGPLEAEVQQKKGNEGRNSTRGPTRLSSLSSRPSSLFTTLSIRHLLQLEAFR